MWQFALSSVCVSNMRIRCGIGCTIALDVCESTPEEEATCLTMSYFCSSICVSPLSLFKFHNPVTIELCFILRFARQSSCSTMLSTCMRGIVGNKIVKCMLRNNFMLNDCNKFAPCRYYRVGRNNQTFMRSLAVYIV